MAMTVSILGCGNIGSAMAKGFIKSGKIDSKNIFLTRRNIDSLITLKNEGFTITDDNAFALTQSKVIILAVGPGQIVKLLQEINPNLTGEHVLISVVSGVTVSDIQAHINDKVPVVRAMPNTAATLGESMTCLATTSEFEASLQETIELFNLIGSTLRISEGQMASATALGACGVAFFLRAIRAASQGGIEIGFHADEAFTIAAQTARGAASLLLDNDSHPESEIDKVTTPKGATIAGLNEMEHQGFSSALIKGITTSTGKIDKLFKK